MEGAAETAAAAFLFSAFRSFCSYSFFDMSEKLGHNVEYKRKRNRSVVMNVFGALLTAFEIDLQISESDKEGSL